MPTKWNKGLVHHISICVNRQFHFLVFVFFIVISVLCSHSITLTEVGTRTRMNKCWSVYIERNHIYSCCYSHPRWISFFVSEKVARGRHDLESSIIFDFFMAGSIAPALRECCFWRGMHFELLNCVNIIFCYDET